MTIPNMDGVRARYVQYGMNEVLGRTPVSIVESRCTCLKHDLPWPLTVSIVRNVAEICVYYTLLAAT